MLAVLLDLELHLLIGKQAHEQLRRSRRHDQSTFGHHCCAVVRNTRAACALMSCGSPCSLCRSTRNGESRGAPWRQPRGGLRLRGA